jgi:hypothetical protein
VRLLLILAFLAFGCASRGTIQESRTVPDVRLTLNGAHQGIVCLRACEVLLTVRFSDSAPEEILRHRGVLWDYGDGSWSMNDRYGEASVKYVLTRWHTFRRWGTYEPRVLIYGAAGRVVASASARVQIGSPE